MEALVQWCNATYDPDTAQYLAEWYRANLSPSDADWVMTAVSREYFEKSRVPGGLSASFIPELLALGYNSSAEVKRICEGKGRANLSFFRKEVMQAGIDEEANYKRRLCESRRFLGGEIDPFPHSGAWTRKTYEGETITATPDFIYFKTGSENRDTGGFCVIEVKTTLSPTRFGEAPHPNHVVQVLVQAWVIGAAWTHLVYLLPQEGKLPRERVFEIRPDKEHAYDIIQRAIGEKAELLRDEKIDHARRRAIARAVTRELADEDITWSEVK